MLKVTIDMVPFGIKEQTRTIGEIEIALIHNDRGTGHYRSRISVDGKGPSQPVRNEVRLTHPRNEGAYRLVQKCIEEHWREADAK